MIGPIPSSKRLKEMLDQGKNDPHEVVQVLNSLYGETLLERIRQAGLLQQLPQEWDRRHLLECLGMIGQCVTKEDVQNSKELSTDQLRAAMIPFRNPTQPLTDKSLWPQLEGYSSLTDRRCVALTRYEHHIWRIGTPKQESSAPSFALREALIKFVAYAKPESIHVGTLIPVYREEIEEVIYYELKSQFHRKGLHAYLYAPLNQTSFPSILLFRGTNGPKSFQRGCQPFALGKAVFDECKNELRDMVKKDCPSKKLEIMGHSLGGLDAQRMIAFLVRDLVEGSGSSADLEEINAFMASTPKLDDPTVQGWEQDLSLLEKRPDPPKIGLNYIEHQEDLVTWIGNRNLTDGGKGFVTYNYCCVQSTEKFRLQNFGFYHCFPFYLSGFMNCQVPRRFTSYNNLKGREAADQASALVSIGQEDWVVLYPEEQGWVVVRKSEEFSTAERVQQQNALDVLKQIESVRRLIQRQQQGSPLFTWALSPFQLAASLAMRFVPSSLSA